MFFPVIKRLVGSADFGNPKRSMGETGLNDGLEPFPEGAQPKPSHMQHERLGPDGCGAE
jgi:hypothetical protein